jgi:beta-glucosidase
MSACPEARIGVSEIKIFLFLLVCCLLAGSVLPQENPPYRDSRLPLEQRVADLLSRMTLEEKIAQLTSAMERTAVASDPKSSLVDAQGSFLPERAAVLMKNGIGQISRPSGMRGPRETAEFTNSIQKWVRDNTRLGIPVLFHEECLHGHAAQKGTSFPQAIALASTWDPQLVEDVFSATASEVRARGSQQCLAPVLDLARDPRWGRTEETYGEDPYLGSRIGVAAVRGFQGHGPLIDRSHVIATAKHFAGHGQPEGGSNAAPGNYSERVIREYFLKPFEAAVKEGKTKVSVDVVNSSAVRGDEVVQLYIRDEVSSVTRPVKELRGFCRITLDAGKTQTVEFTLGPEELSFLNRDMRRVVEPGTFKVLVGGNSVHLIDTTLKVVAK